jgi:hypothetical protein
MADPVTLPLCPEYQVDRNNGRDLWVARLGLTIAFVTKANQPQTRVSCSHAHCSTCFSINNANKTTAMSTNNTLHRVTSSVRQWQKTNVPWHSREPPPASLTQPHPQLNQTSLTRKQGCGPEAQRNQVLGW